MARRPALLALSLLSLAPSVVPAAEPLDVDLKRDLAILLLSGGAAGGMGLYADRMTPDACRYCAPNGFDVNARLQLRWENPRTAASASDLLANGLIPAAALAHAALMSWGDGGARQLGEDSLAIGEAVLLSIDANELVKSAAGRIRPSAWAAGQLQGTSSNRSFYSGHTALAFSLASAAGTVSTIRGYRSAPWVWAIGMTLASGVGYLRVAADAHWTTDVLAGAAIGGSIGFAVPWMLHRPRRRRDGGIALEPAPGGFALRW